MKFKNSKIALLFILLLVPFLLTGCTDNSSAKSVAVKMVEKLSKGDYKNIGNIFYQEENSYFDEDAFKNAVDDKDLNIKGNKKIEVKEVGEEITNSDGNTTVQVKISIDNNKVFTIDTIEKDGKWYVYEPDFYDGSIEIVVPSGSSVKLNDKKINKKTAKKEKIDVEVNYPSSSYKEVDLSDVVMDTYKIENVIKGKYSIAVENKNTNTVKDVVYTYSKTSGSNSDNYERDSDYSNRNVQYVFKLKSKNDSVEKYVNKYLNDIYNNLTSTKSFDGVQKYFDSTSDEYSTIKSNYGSLISKVGSAESSSYLSDFKVNNLKYMGTYYFDDNNIVAMFEYKLTYKRNYRTSSSDKNVSMQSIAVLKKDSKNDFIITDGYSLFAK